MSTEVVNNEKKKFDQVINEIETVIDCGFKFPGLGVVVSPKEIRNNLHSLRKAVNSAVEEAEHIMAIKEKIIEEAKKEADEIVRRRQLEVTKEPIIKEAENIAKQILIQAKKEAEKMVKDAQVYEKEIRERSVRYAEVIFNELEKDINEKRKRVTRDRQELKMILENHEENAKVQQESIEPQRKLS